MRVLLTFLVFISCNLYSKDKPNIIIILTDDLGWGDVSYHGGYIPTPNIDQLAEEAIAEIDAVPVEGVTIVE